MHSIFHRIAPTSDLLQEAARFLPRLVPIPIFNQLTQLTFNHLFSAALREGQLDFLEGRIVCIAVPDVAQTLCLTARQCRLRVPAAGCRADVTLRANFAVLVDIITATSDPDTLFFQRQLVIEGDTELGLALKNFLDTCDPQALLPKPLYQLLRQHARRRHGER